MLRQGPVDKKDGKPCENWELTFKAICNNIQHCPLPHNWNQQTAEAKIVRKHEKVKVNLSWKIYSSYLLVGELESCRNAFPRPTFHLVSVPFQWLFWKDAQARHYPIALKSHKSHRPPCQAPGLGSFRANFVAVQVDVRNRFVDFQRFGKGLRTKTMSNHVKHENLQCDLRQ